jgi:hypothetical protein
MAGINAAPTLVARRTDTGDLLTVADDPAQLRALSDARLLTCPHCGSALLYKAGNVRLHHFAHISLNDCTYADHEPESEMHRLGKFTLFRKFRAGASEAALERHIPQTDQRADCFVTHGNNSYALEFQQANNTAERWTERHTMYRSQNICDLWFLGTVRYQASTSQPPRPVTPYDPLPVPRGVYEASAGMFRIREMEKAMLRVSDRLVYLDPETELLTILLSRLVSANTLRAYRYVVPMAEAELRDGALWTPLETLLQEYYKFRGARQTQP